MEVMEVCSMAVRSHLLQVLAAEGAPDSEMGTLVFSLPLRTGRKQRSILCT